MVSKKSTDKSTKKSRANIANERIFVQQLGRLRVLSNNMRSEHHEKIINWVDRIPLKSGNSGEALTMVLPTRGCKYAMAKHGGCSMCTLPMDNPLNPNEDLINSLPDRTYELFLTKGGSERFRGVKFYTSGSFLDTWELPVLVREQILSKFVNLVDEITIETRCEFVIRKHLDNVLNVVPSEKLIVAIGQETTDDEINRRSVNKGHKYRQFKRAVDLLHSLKIRSKGYILLKPIFMSELSAVDDALRTAKHMADLGVTNISINPCYIGKKTLMEQLFYEGTYQPPWLWSVFFVAVKVKTLVGSKINVIADPVAAGSERGPRNCGKCDRLLKEKLKEFSANQDLDTLDGLYCECQEIYRSSLSTEHLSNGMGISSIFFNQIRVEL